MALKTRGWMIFKDYLYENHLGAEFGKTQVGTKVKGYKPDWEQDIRFRLYDDDKILYYEGIASDEDEVELAHTYWQNDSGVTYSEILSYGEWVPFVG